MTLLSDVSFLKVERQKTTKARMCQYIQSSEIHSKGHACSKQVLSNTSRSSVWCIYSVPPAVLPKKPSVQLVCLGEKLRMGKWGEKPLVSEVWRELLWAGSQITKTRGRYQKKSQPGGFSRLLSEVCDCLCSDCTHIMTNCE